MDWFFSGNDLLGEFNGIMEEFEDDSLSSDEDIATSNFCTSKDDNLFTKSFSNNLNIDDQSNQKPCTKNDNCLKTNANSKLQNISNANLKQCSGSYLNVDIVEKIEKDLEFYEIVSILFLVYEDNELESALDHLTVACNSVRRIKNFSLITEWCRTEPKFWREKFLQALVIIKNFYVLSRLGFKKDEANCLNERKHSYVSSVRKLIYDFCESLSLEESKCFIDKINNDLKLKNGNDNIILYDPRFLELSFLFWLSRKYIYFYVNKVDFLNIVECLKNFKELSSIKKSLQSIHKHFNKQKCDERRYGVTSMHIATQRNFQNFIDYILPTSKRDKLFEPEKNLNNTTGRVSPLIPSAYSHVYLPEYNIDYYEIINSSEIGLCIIINQSNFKNRETKTKYKNYLSSDILSDRDGTESDVNAIRDTFSKLLYKVITVNDLSHIDMLDFISLNVQQQFVPSIHSSLLLFILSHGYEGHVYGCNSIAVSIDTVKRTVLECRNVIGKPKGIIIQACQGTARQEVVTADGPNDRYVNGSIPRFHGECDLFVGLASVAGHVAYRNSKSGTWFIQTLCDCINIYADKMDFVKIFTRVNDQITQKRTSDRSGITVGQVSEYRSSLRTEWYLVPPRSVNMIHQNKP
ncbi:caspase-8 Dredd [Lycorma delicatula]|uniref:caspase-8 Dredd n=1 Tax=Lycorma delicatula TaxID=130591 RepID=UPI003F50EFF4